jgi:hypothetical protein
MHALGNQPDEKYSADAEYLKTLNAPFDWEEARRRVQQSIAPAEMTPTS